MYNQPVGPLAATGVGAGGAATFMSGPLMWLFIAIAIFTLMGAFGALVRSLPRPAAFNRRPKSLAPTTRPSRSRRR